MQSVRGFITSAAASVERIGCVKHVLLVCLCVVCVYDVCVCVVCVCGVCVWCVCVVCV
jgi:hypothetical protein